VPTSSVGTSNLTNFGLVKQRKAVTHAIQVRRLGLVHDG